MVGGLIVLSACANRSPEFKSQGLEDLVSCQFDTEAAEVMDSSHITQIRARTLEEVGPEIFGPFDDQYGLVKAFSRPRVELTIFGAQVHGVFLFTMHGSAMFSAVAEGDVDETRSAIENHSGLVFASVDEHTELAFLSPEIVLEKGISMRDFAFEKEIKARSSIVVSRKMPSLFVVGCNMTLYNRFQDTSGSTAPADRE